MGFKYQEALDSGYSDQEIAEYLAPKRKYNLKGALDAGYSHSDIVQHLLKKQSTAEASTRNHPITKHPPSQKIKPRWTT